MNKSPDMTIMRRTEISNNKVSRILQRRTDFLQGIGQLFAALVVGMARNPSMKEDLFTCPEGEQLKGQIQNCFVKAKWVRNEYNNIT